MQSIGWTFLAAVVAAAASVAPPAGATSAHDAALHLSGKIGPRPAASRGETRAQGYVASEFRAAGLTVGVDTFGVPGKGTSRNVVGELDGPASCLQIVMGHVDSGPKGPGANDNASGVGVLVALAPRLAALKPGCDVWLASTWTRSAATPVSGCARPSRPRAPGSRARSSPPRSAPGSPSAGSATRAPGTPTSASSTWPASAQPSSRAGVRRSRAASSHVTIPPAFRSARWSARSAWPRT